MAKLSFNSVEEIKEFYGIPKDEDGISPHRDRYDTSYCRTHGGRARTLRPLLTVYLQTHIAGLDSPMKIVFATFVKQPLKHTYELEEATFNGMAVPKDQLDNEETLAKINGMIRTSTAAFAQGKLPEHRDVFPFGITEERPKPRLQIVAGGKGLKVQ